jgi:hypothetical protein
MGIDLEKLTLAVGITTMENSGEFVVQCTTI